MKSSLTNSLSFKIALLFLLCTALPVLAQKQKKEVIVCKLENQASLPKSAREISGMVYSKGGFWIHNDSGNPPFIMFMKKNGAVETLKEITLAPNYDWEDITADKKGNLYIGDVGNNANTRRTLQIYKIKDPHSTDEMRIAAEKIEFSYPDQYAFPPKPKRMIYDAEAIIYFKDSIFVFNKNRTVPYDGYARVYKIPAKPGSYKAILADSIYLGGDAMLSAWVTGAAVSADDKKIALLSHDKAWLFSDFKGSNFFKGKVQILDFQHFSQKEAIAFDEAGDIFIADELVENVLGGKLYRLIK
jgi:hypothetical protein